MVGSVCANCIVIKEEGSHQRQRVLGKSVDMYTRGDLLNHNVSLIFNNNFMINSEFHMYTDY